MQPSVLTSLQEIYGDRLIANFPMATSTTMKVGGTADWGLLIDSLADLEKALQILWSANERTFLLGGGSNILVSDAGIRSVVVVNRASSVKLDQVANPPTLWAEAGVTLFQLSRAASEAGLSGLEWCSLIPGTVGGAVFGNAGAHGGETCKNLVLAEILHRTKGKLSLSNADLGFSYRNSSLKKEPGEQVILSATFQLSRSTPQAVHARINELVEKRRLTQPAGAGFGSTFRNPPGDKAGRLIEAAGLKGIRQGGAVISSKHANFIINEGSASAGDVWILIQKAFAAVLEKFQVALIPEIELVGEWSPKIRSEFETMRASAVES